MICFQFRVFDYFPPLFGGYSTAFSLIKVIAFFINECMNAVR